MRTGTEISYPVLLLLLTHVRFGHIWNSILRELRLLTQNSFVDKELLPVWNSYVTYFYIKSSTETRIQAQRSVPEVRFVTRLFHCNGKERGR